MYTLKFKIGEQWRVYPANTYFYGHGKVVREPNGFYLHYVNSDKKVIEVTTFLTAWEKTFRTMKIGDDFPVFYILRFHDTTDVIVFDDDYLEHDSIFVMENGKTVDSI